MGWKEVQERQRARLLTDEGICEANRQLFADFFTFEEYKLKRMNGLQALDDGCHKTIISYISRLRNVNQWFGNRPWVELTKEDIKSVYDALEDGTIRNRSGVPFRERRSYYNKIFKSKPFQLAGKAELAREVIEYAFRNRKDVRFVTEETFKTLVSVLSKPRHLLLAWLAWDVGENVDALLKLNKRNFILQTNRHTGEREYLVNLPEGKIKRSRQTRSEPMLYPETVRYADMVLRHLQPDDKVFSFEYRGAHKVLQRAVAATGATTQPNGEPVRWKDLRSGMACHLLKVGWTRDEINARLGHTPHSDALDAYINFLALDRDRPKRRLHESSVELLQRELSEANQHVKLSADRVHRIESENQMLLAEVSRTRDDIRTLREKVERLLLCAPRAA